MHCTEALAKAFHKFWTKKNIRDVKISRWLLLPILDVQTALFPLEGVPTCVNLNKEIDCYKSYEAPVYGIEKVRFKGLIAFPSSTIEADTKLLLTN